jgi:hypothetical protein
VGAEIEPVDVCTLACQKIFQCSVDGEDFCDSVETESNAALVRDHNHTHSRAVKSSDGSGHARQQMKVIPPSDVLAFRQLPVHHSVAVEENSAQALCVGKLGGVEHTIYDSNGDLGAAVLIG